MVGEVKVVFVNPSKVKEGYVEAEDCCWGAGGKRVLPAMLLSCASQVKNATFIDLAIDDIGILKSKEPDVIVFPLAWQYHREVFQSLSKFCAENHVDMVVLAVPAGYVREYAELNPLFVVYSEPELVMKEWAESGFDNDWIKSAKGIAFKDDKGQIVVNEPHKCRFNEVGKTNYNLVPKHYWKKYNVAVVQATRGCPYRCKFCVWGGSTITDKTFKMRDPKIVSEDMKSVWSMLDGKFIYLLSAQLTTNLQWIREFSNHMEGSGIRYQSNVRIDEVTPEKLELLKKSGIVAISAGVDALSEHMLLRLKKGYTLNEIKRGLVILDDCGVPYNIHLRLGCGEGILEVEETIKALDELNALELKNISAGLGPLVFYKGTVFGDSHPCDSVPSLHYEEYCPIMKNIPREWNIVGQKLKDMGWIK